jgi:uncharacterized protein YndB with AHSA1/START domain
VIDQTETHIHIERTVNVPAAELFAVLVEPGRHREIDGSATVQGRATGAAISAVGQVFTMSMHASDLGEYISENHVVEFEPGRRITWETTRDGKPPVGFRWGWEVQPMAAGRTLVTHTYDWSRVSDEAVLKRVNFPRVSAKEMNETVTRLAAIARQ